MRFLIIALLTLSLSTAYSQDYWEELVLPSNLPVRYLTIENDSSIYATGLGIYKLDKNGNWESRNHLKTNFQGTEFDGDINELGMSVFELLVLENNTLVTIFGEGLVIKSTDNGDNWDIISDEVSRPQLIFEYENTPYFIGRKGVFKLNAELDSIIDLTNEDIYIYDAVHNGDKVIVQYNDDSRNESLKAIKIFDLETEKIQDSVILEDFGMNGNYYENGNFSYAVENYKLYVSDRVLRSGSEPVITTYNLDELIDPERLEEFGAYFSKIRFFDNGRLIIPNTYSDDYIVADAGFKNPKLHNINGLGYSNNWSVSNIYAYENDYLVCSDLGLYKAEGKDLNNLENISLNMGAGVYESVEETGTGYNATLRGVMYDITGGKLEILNTIESELLRWNHAYLYKVEDTVFVTKDFGATWTNRIIKEKTYESENRSQSNGLFSITGNDSIYFIKYNDLSVYAVENPKFISQYSEVKHVIVEDNIIYVITSEGTYKLDDIKGWVNLATYNYSDDIGTFVSYDGTNFELTNGNLIAFSDWGIIYSEDHGETIQLHELNIPRNPDQKYFRSGNKFYFYGSNDQSQVYDFYELHFDEQNNIVTKMLSDDDSPSIFQSYTPTIDGKLIISNLSGTYKSKDQIISSVELENNAIANELVIYPNISDSQITVVTEGIGKSELMIYDLKGNKQNVVVNSISAGNTILNISNLAEGMYIISKGGQSGFFFKR